ncbi:MAG TPA: hypothetical protein VFQ61_33270 [Polyangiaceae bacterium]|nr:hypothetical protein [Polyangiaceae bacterium]
MKKSIFLSVFAAATTLSALVFACPGHGPEGRAKLDTNSDGKITLDEMRTAAKERFGRIDADKNGVLSKEELQKRGRARMMLERADTNGDGQITTAELEAHTATKFKEMDTNKDGALSHEELRAGFKHGFKHRHGGPDGKQPPAKS